MWGLSLGVNLQLHWVVTELKSALESTFQALAAEEGLSFFTQNRHSIYVGNAFTTVADGNCAFNACGWRF